MKICVTKVNASALLDKAKGYTEVFKMLGVDVTKAPKEQKIWLDTNHISRIDTVLPPELSSGCFVVKMDDDATPLTIKETDFDRLLRAWLDYSIESTIG